MNKRRNKTKFDSVVKEYLPYVIVIVAIILIRTFLVTLVKVDGSSMYPNLKNGQILILNKIDKTYKRFDVVVINFEGEKLVKRIIGMPNETLEYKNDKLYINGEEIKEKFSKKETEDFKLKELGYKKIPDNYYFVVGDNRDNSLDSRMIGLINKEDIKGTTKIRLFPFDKIGKIK